MKNKKAFSLVELSIVLVVIGLLIAGISTGSRLIQVTKLQGVLLDLSNIRNAIASFNATYQGLPGDLANSTDFFDQCATDTDTTTLSACDGDGDGIIEKPSGTGTDDARESFRAHYFLDESGIYTQSLSDPGGIDVGSATDAVIGENVPKSRIFSNVGYSISGDSGSAKDAVRIYAGGNNTSSADDVTDGEVFTHVQAYNMDNKIDDGLPRAGNIQSRGDTTCDDETVYDLTDDATTSCSIYSRVGDTF